MTQTVLTWLVLIAGSFLTGASLVGILVVRRIAELPVALAGAVAFGAAIFFLGTLPARYARPDAALWGFVIMAGFAIGGYAVASASLHALTGSLTLPALEVPDTARPGTGVILTACVEPDSYDPRSTACMLEELVDEGVMSVSNAALPFLFFAQKARYRVIADRSPARADLQRISDRLGSTLGEDDEVAWAACNGRESVARAVVEAANRGLRTIVVAGLGVAESVHFIRARHAIEDLRLHEHGVEIRFTGMFADSERTLTMLAGRIATATGSTETGVVLVGHGQPPSRAKRNPGFDERELGFLSRLRMLLLERGADPDAIRIAWAEWADPDVTSSVRHLAALGYRRVLVSPAVYPLDTLATRLDLEMAVRQARVDEGVSVVTMPSWKDDDAVISELHDRVAASGEGA